MSEIVKYLVANKVFFQYSPLLNGACVSLVSRRGVLIHVHSDESDLYDTFRVDTDTGVKFENLIAVQAIETVGRLLEIVEG